VEDRLPRKLAAILHADIAGYSRLAGEDEDTTHRRLKESLELISKKVTSYHGRVINYAGDAVLAMFESVVDAVSCAVAIQHDLTKFNRDVPDERKLQYRIGINMGDVIEDCGDIFGDGVNVAARLEGLAEPGGICIAESVHIAVGGKLPLDYQDIGAQSVKNIAEPVRVYQVALKPGTELPQPSKDRKPVEPLKIKKWKPLAVALIIVLTIAVGAAYWFKPWKSEEVRVSAKQKAMPLPDKPSIAVLPFTNMSSDKEQEYFVDGMTEDLITDLSKISGLFVIARNSVFTYKDKAVNVRQVAEELAVRYVMEGSVRRVGNQVRINAQLIDATTGGHIWAERYDGKYEDVFALQDMVTSKIVATLAVKLTTGEQERIDRKETENTQAYDTFLKGWEQYLRQTPESFRQAITLFKKAIELDPGYSRAYAALSLTHWQGWKSYWHNKLGYISAHDIRFEAEEYLAKAMEEPTPLALQISTVMHAQWGRHDEAVAEGERAIAMDPNDADGYVALAGALNLAGNPDKAIALMERAMRLNPHYPTSYLHELGLARFGMEKFDKAAVTLRQAVSLNPDDRWSSRLLIATLGQLDRTGEAVAIIDRVEENWRGFDPLSVRGTAFWYPFKEQVDAERLTDGLRKAGVPD
jgi:adenylate cyclase